MLLVILPIPLLPKLTEVDMYLLMNHVFFSFDFQVPSKEVIRLEQDVFLPMAGTATLFMFQTSQFWSQIKSAG